MEIIKTPAKELKCTECDTLLRITNADLRERHEHLWLTHGRFYIICPVCGEKISVRERIKEGGAE